jgi:DNA gyrase subunit A
VNVLEVEEHFQLFLITQFGKLIRIPVENIRTIGRVTQGNRLIRLEKDEQVIGIAPVIEGENDEETTAGGENPPAGENSTDAIADSGPDNVTENTVRQDVPEEPKDPPSSDDSSDS